MTRFASSADPALQQPSFASLSGLLSFALSLYTAVQVVQGAELGGRPFHRIVEPSGIQQLADGRFIVVEDEAWQPLSALALSPHGVMSELPLYRMPYQLFAYPNLLVGTVDDLEGAAVDADGRAYIITSHSRKTGGQRDSRREQLLRFHLDAERIAEVQVVRTLREQLLRVSPLLRDADHVKQVKEGGGLNIEGLAFDPTGNRLLIGLRSPVDGEHALITSLENPSTVFEAGQKPRIGNRLIRLNLDGGGIRGFCYDAHLGGYLLISRRPGKAFKLWFWGGESTGSPRRIKAPQFKALSQPEGVTPVIRNGKPEGILIVSDSDSARKQRTGRYLLLPYGELHIDK